MKAAARRGLVWGTLCLSGMAALGWIPESRAAPAAPDTAAGAEPQAFARLVGGYSEFAGSQANARSLVAGLLQGGEIMLAPRGRAEAAAGARFVPPTRPLAYANVRIALALAQEQLAQLGITQPVPAQIKAVLLGGAVTSRADARGTPVLLPGVLAMYAAGMAWSRVAETMGLSLAAVMSGRSRPSPAATAVAPRPGAAVSMPAGAGDGDRRPAAPKHAAPVKRGTGGTAAQASTPARAAGRRAAAPAAGTDATPQPADARAPQESRGSAPGATRSAESADAEPAAGMPVLGSRSEPLPEAQQARAAESGAAGGLAPEQARPEQ